MKTRTIGPLVVSEVGLGGNQFGRKIDAGQSKRVIAAALDMGISFIDTSDTYGRGSKPYSARGRSEEYIGSAIRGRRDEVVLASKFGNPASDDPMDRGGRPDYVRLALERSLSRLKVDHIDLYQIHRPDSDTPIAETLGALTDAVSEGKVRVIGCSNFSRDQLQEAKTVAESEGTVRFASVQNEYNLLRRQAGSDVVGECERLNVAFLPYFPLAGGLLTGKYRLPGSDEDMQGGIVEYGPSRDYYAADEANLGRVHRLDSFARQRGMTILELAFGWLLSHKMIASVIAGATTEDQVRANVGAAESVIENGDLAELNRVLNGL